MYLAIDREAKDSKLYMLGVHTVILCSCVQQLQHYAYIYTHTVECIFAARESYSINKHFLHITQLTTSKITYVLEIFVKLISP